MDFNSLYFFTSTIIDWKKLLAPDKYKDIIITSLKYLVEHQKIVVYGFVIMPNHIHLIWELLIMNGKEKPNASLMKFTAHKIQEDLCRYHPHILELFKVDSSSRKYNFWQREGWPVTLYTPEVIYQKLDYIHNNPVQGKWMLVNSPIEYKYSSARFYETGIDEFGFLTHIGDRL
jgi:putative transposase